MAPHAIYLPSGLWQQKPQVSFSRLTIKKFGFCGFNICPNDGGYITATRNTLKR